MNFADAEYYGVANGDMMQLKIISPDCSVTFEDVLVRADEAAKLEVHIDTDEGNACNLEAATEVILKKDELRLSRSQFPHSFPPRPFLESAGNPLPFLRQFSDGKD